MKNNMRNQNAITLIALVITIIVMFILAGVAISVLTNDGGLFDKTRWAANVYGNASQNEADYIAWAGEQLDVDQIESEQLSASLGEFNLSVTRTSTSIIVEGETSSNETDMISGFQFLLKEVSNARSIGKWTSIQSEPSYTFTKDDDGIERDKDYMVSMRKIDKEGKMRGASNNNEIVNAIEVVPIASVVEVGQYINYDAGVWKSEDIQSIIDSPGATSVHSTVNDDDRDNQTLPNVQGQFGGFELGQSRNTNSTPIQESNTPRTAGWRVWDKDEETGLVTLICAGHTETYFNKMGNSAASVSILTQRDCSMYVNEYATSARILSGHEATMWYNKYFKTSYPYMSAFNNKVYSTAEPISVLDNNSYYWFATAYDSKTLYCNNPVYHYVGPFNYDRGFGVRVLIELRTDALVERDTGNGEKDTPWILAL